MRRKRGERGGDNEKGGFRERGEMNQGLWGEDIVVNKAEAE